MPTLQEEKRAMPRRHTRPLVSVNRALAPRVLAAREALLRKRLVLGAMGLAEALDAEQVDHEHEWRVRRNRWR